MSGQSVKPLAEPRRCEIWFADVAGDKRRPVLVLTRDPMGRHLSSVICAPITSRIRNLSTEVLVGPEEGLANVSAVNCDNVFLLSRNRLLKRLGRASDELMTAVCNAVAIAIGCNRPRS